MKLVMTLLVRDEVDIVDAQLAFHLAAGVDFVIATDNASQDGTVEILERYERAGYLHLLHDDETKMQQDVLVTRMARLAATEFGADWVINSDADEFWWPRGGSLKEVFSAVPARFGTVRGCWRHFLPRPDDNAFFADRMTVRLCAPAFPGDKRTIYHAHQKVAHRAHPGVQVEPGNHDVTGDGLETLRGWHPIEVLHFSFRSPGQLVRKCGGNWWNRAPEDVTLHKQLLYDAYVEGRIEEYYGSFAVSDEALESGIAGGRLAIDTRLRDALRSLREPHGAFALPGEVGPLDFEHPSILEDAAYAAEASVLQGVDAIVRAEARAAALESQVAALERGWRSRLRPGTRNLRSAAVD